jgi:hypothetical protein
VASWLTREQDDQRRALVPLDWWRPDEIVARLGEEVPWGSLRYIVVDELVRGAPDVAHGVAGLVVSPWPGVDASGRLHFADEEDSRHVTVKEKPFLALLARRREPIVAGELPDATIDALRQRKLALGDVFAAPVEERRFWGAAANPARMIRTPWVLDITAIARAVAKGQTAAALAGLLDPDDEQG